MSPELAKKIFNQINQTKLFLLKKDLINYAVEYSGIRVEWYVIYFWFEITLFGMKKGGSSPLILLHQNHFTSLHKTFRLQSIEINSAGKIYRIPIYLINSCFLYFVDYCL